MTDEGTIEFRLLGPLEARLENRPLPLGGVRQRGLLAILLLRANEVVSRDRLIDELWRDHAPESAANALAALVSRLRRVLPADVLVTRSRGYQASVETDRRLPVRASRRGGKPRTRGRCRDRSGRPAPLLWTCCGRQTTSSS
jgi:DNA-binding SARP family transcriptional activator